MRKYIFTALLMMSILGQFEVLSQGIAINNDNSDPDPSAMLDVKSTEQGLLIPRMDSVQRVNIISPADGLLVYQTNNNSFYYYTGSDWIRLGQDNLGNHSASQNLQMNGHYISGDGDDEGLFVNNTGYVGVNQFNPLSMLDVNGTLNVTDTASIGGASVGDGDFRGNFLNGVINCGGAYRLYTNTLSDETDPFISFATGDEDLFIHDDLEVVGTAYKTGGGSWTSLSDERLKKNIEPFEEGLDRVLQIKPVSFQYNESSFVPDQEKRFIGIIAQDMLSVAPYMVEEIPMGQVVREIENGVDEIIEPGRMVYTFDPSALDFLLINSVKEQQEMIEHLKQKIEELEMTLNKLTH
jgi:hypothetical protein